MNRLSLIVLVLSFTFTTPVMAVVDGNELLQNCQEAEYFIDNGQYRDQSSWAEGNYCVGVVTGVLFTYQYLNSGISDPLVKLCAPEKMIVKQAIRIVLKYLRAKPEMLHNDPPVLIMLALLEAFPCE